MLIVGLRWDSYVIAKLAREEVLPVMVVMGTVHMEEMPEQMEMAALVVAMLLLGGRI